MKKLIPVFITAAAMLMQAGCSQEPAIVVTNQSGITLTNVILSGSGFSQRIDRLPPRAVTKFMVSPKGPSGVEVAFDAGGRHFDTKGQIGLFRDRGRYLVDVVIGPDLRLTVLSESRGY
ncbi:MAG TPA: hypothetical protein PLF54_03555 [Deltaproteobacteria bacterium]|nr:hypothetical protein [Deltaproteobacteria bacterium]